MKFLLPLALAFLTAACATPKPQQGTAAHQRMLEEEARQNFMALKAREHKHAAPAASTRRIARNEAPRPIGAFRRIDDLWRDGISWLREEPRRIDETIYYHDVRPRPRPKATLSRAYEKYARELGKKPEDLTPKEREWARGHY